MNRTEFMNQLEILLQNISNAEKEEALQYYNDYFDDAGAENEQSVIEALGNPARVAENIRRDLLENQTAGSTTAADRAVVEYGKADAFEETKEVPAISDESHIRSVSETTAEVGKSNTTGGPGFDRTAASNGGAGFDRAAVSNGAAGSSGSRGYDGGGGRPGAAGAPGKPGMSGGMIVLIAILVVFASPVILGGLSILFGLLVMWFALILSFGIVFLALFAVLIALLIVGGLCIPVDPLAGLAVMGGGLICGGLGILFLMLTVAMAGIITPAIFRGIGCLFRFGRREAVA